MHDGVEQTGLARFSYETACFLRDYLASFRKSFGQFCAEAEIAPKLPTDTEQFAERLYLSMFSQSANEQLLHETLREFVIDAVDAEPVLLKTWMHMINDYVDVLEDTSASTGLLLELVQWIDYLSSTLYRTYFRLSQEFTHDASKWTPAAIQQSTDIARGFVTLHQQAQTKGMPTKLQGCCYFRGVEVHLEAILLSADDRTISCRMDQRQCAIVAHTSFMVIQHAEHDRYVLAEILQVDHEQRRVTAQHFEWLSCSRNRRSEVRVEPAEPIDIYFKHAQGESHGLLINLSTNSLAVYLRNTGVDLSDSLTIAFKLPCAKSESNTVSIECSATVQQIRADRRGDHRAHRLIVKLDTDTATEHRLSQYLTQRQTEILREIRRLVEAH